MIENNGKVIINKLHFLKSIIKIMGNKASVPGNTDNVYPAYYTEVKPTADDAVIAKHVWTLVQTDTGKKFNEMKLNPDFNKASCMEWFYEVKIAHLFFTFIELCLNISISLN